MRAFFALDIDEASLRAIGDLSRRLASSKERPSAKMSFSDPAQMHVTVQFLGDIEDARAPEFVAVAADLAYLGAPRALLDDPTAFPSALRARTIVVPLEDPDGALARLAAEVASRTLALGIPREARPYRPHVTLARVRSGPTDARAWLAKERVPASLKLSAFALYRSDAAPTGTKYTSLARFPYSTSQAPSENSGMSS